VAKSSPVKVSVECPHCNFKQMDYAAAKSTMCRQCGRHFSPSAPPAEVRHQPREAPGAMAADLGASIRGKFESLWAAKRSSVIECFDCKAHQEVVAAAPSTNCRKCGAHQDLRDYKITTSFSRSIRTHGQVHLTAKGDLSSTSVIARSAVIEGKLRGNLQCSETAKINFVGKIPGRLAAQHVLIERRSDVQFFRRVRAKNIEIHGRMIGDVVAETVVVIHRHGALDGSVTAKAISVEKGGMFSGQLIIGSVALKQAELLPQAEAGEQSREAETPLLLPHPLPAA
jgi:cytoskeletal protein CcmA (bactofilin family)/ribosomal protein S27E